MSKSGKVAACILAKDAETAIGKTIESILPVADFVVVVVDDRSTDNTFQFCNEGLLEDDPDDIRVVFPQFRKWNHSYSDARNFAAKLAERHGADWIISMDHDEDLEPECIDRFKAVLSKPEVDLITCPLFVDPTYGAPAYLHPEFGNCSIVWRNRVYRPAKASFTLRAHEQLAFTDQNYSEVLENIRFFHRGSMTWEKDDYYTALQVLDNVDLPEHPIPATMLAEAAIQSDDPVRAARFLKQIDPDRIQDGPNASRYWIAKGKMSQRHG